MKRHESQAPRRAALLLAALATLAGLVLGACGGGGGGHDRAHDRWDALVWDQHDWA